MTALILNVDDNEAARYSATRILRRAGYEVIEAGTATEALRLAAERKPRLVILDVNLPDSSGFDVCRQLKGEPLYVSTLVLQTSATHLDNDARVQSLNAGADGYLIQPADPDVLLATVRSLLRIGEAEAALRTASAKLSSILDSITDLFISFDRDLRISDINERAAVTIFKKGRTQVIGRLLADEEAEGTAVPILESELRRALSQQAPVHFETSTVTPGQWFEAHVYPTAESLAVYLRDISDRKQAAEEIRQLLVREQAARELAEAASRAKDDFLATMSHELRSPINAILLWTNLLTSSALDANATARAIASIDRSARMQARLIDDLLDISRIVAGKLNIDRVELSLASAIEAAVEYIRNDAKVNDISIETHLGKEVAVVHGDATRLQQVFANLLSNAVKFSSPGGRVTISMRSEPNTVTVQVVDGGQGISAAFLPYVFEPFRQADSSTTRSHGGLGLGTAIVRNLVLIHGGEVTAESDGEGHGSTFTVRLPRRAGRVVNDHAGSELDDSELFAGCRILLVDDDVEFRNALAAQLRDWGATVTTAASAREAFELFERLRPNLLLSDIGMPNEDGYSLIRWIRALPAERGGDVKAIALTAYAMPNERSPVIEAGYQLHVSKPVDPSRLRASLLQLIDPGECQ